MNARITRLADYAIHNNLNPEPVQIEFDPFDENLPEPVMIAKRYSEFLSAQPVCLYEDSELVGITRLCGCPVPSDIFPRLDHKHFRDAVTQYYLKPQENLSIFDWQHSNANFGKLIRQGLKGYQREITEAKKNYLGQSDRLAFLTGMEMAIQGLLKRARQYREFCLAEAVGCRNAERRATLLRIAGNIANVPLNPARTFEEGIQCLYFSFMVISDSIGRPDQYLYPLYKHDIEKGTLTREHAKELLQELFIGIFSATPLGSHLRDKGGESHFVIGGYTIDKEDGFNELSDLILESLLETPNAIPQLSLRWNKKTPREVLRKVMDYERRDPKKRIAIVNDEPRIASILNILKLPWEVAYDYIMVGCNEAAYQGGISLGGNTVNIVLSLIETFKKRRREILECTDFDSFYAIFEEELFLVLERALEYSNRYNMVRSLDCNVLSSIFLDGCIERAESATRGGASLARGAIDLMGGTNLIDSLSVIRSFVFEEKRISFEKLLNVLDADWKGEENLRMEILRKGHFFGNNDEFVDSIARRFHRSLYKFSTQRTDFFGATVLFGNLTGYHSHFAVFGAETGATPDGRVAGSALSFGSGQVYGKDTKGITSHLLSVAKMDETGIMCGNTIMNLTVDESVVRDEESFEKLVILIETYFKEGGLHIQLNHISREELIAAKANPSDYKSLRVRVSGFSATFVNLDEKLQDNVIDRTVHTI